ncbi:MAG: hypothetical protein ABGX07_19805, partial [Pirellulaceae bacterium]
MTAENVTQQATHALHQSVDDNNDTRRPTVMFSPPTGGYIHNRDGSPIRPTHVDGPAHPAVTATKCHMIRQKGRISLGGIGTRTLQSRR